jgi:hypothetical protein
MTTTINDRTMTTYIPAANTGPEPVAAAGGCLTPSPAGRRPDDLEAPWGDPLSRAVGAEDGS